METLGRYQINGRLGEGAMADVYRAVDPSIGRKVAIKVLKPEYARNAALNLRFLREARAAGALSHPNIATIYEVGEEHGVAYIAMELVEGQPLDTHLQANGRMPYERVLMLGQQLAGALALDDAMLVVAGDGPLRDDAEALAADLLPGRYRRISLPASEMPALYRSADAFLHLSLLESFGNVFLEAWASGLPVVGHDSERLRWILGESAPYLCDTENEAELARALATALATGRQRSGSMAGVERFGWPTIADEYQQFIATLLSNR